MYSDSNANDFYQGLLVELGCLLLYKQDFGGSFLQKKNCLQADIETFEYHSKLICLVSHFYSCLGEKMQQERDKEEQKQEGEEQVREKHDKSRREESKRVR